MTPEEEAAHQAQVDAELAELAATMKKMATDAASGGFVIRKGEVAAVNDTTSPPTVAINISGDTETLINNVRILNGYTPQLGQTCLVCKQGADIFLLGAIASASALSNGTSTTADDGWIQATLSNGSHNGNSNGNVEYRRILDHGSWKMQWRGGWSPSGTTQMISTADGLDDDFRPKVKRSLIGAREIQTGSVSVGWDFNTDGSVIMIGPTAAPSGTTGSGGSFSGGSHNHSHTDYYGSAGEFSLSNVTSTDPGFSIGSHTHSFSGGVTAPSWVSLNGLEYFL